jgi:murE/murF fusion protein
MKFKEITKALSAYGININSRLFDGEFQISGITDNSEKCKSGFIFVCIRGHRFDGHDIAHQMLSDAEAFCVVCDHDLGLKRQIIVPDTRDFYGKLCAVWFDSPEKKMYLTAVTGTNGKTTTTSLIAQTLAAGGKKIGIIGTTGAYIIRYDDEKKVPAPDNTTPFAYELFELLATFANSNVDVVVMEVSSFALEQGRIGPIVFDVSVFTNLTQDHLDYHETMENYYQAKLRLFADHTKVSIINADDSYGARMVKEVTEKTGGKNVYAYGSSKNCHILMDGFKLEADSSHFRMEAGGQFFMVSTNLVGEYNIYNAGAAIAVCNTLGMGIVAIIRAMAKVHGVMGRCEVIPCNRGFSIICDYAHTPDALVQVCNSLKKTAKKRLIVLFGCGGNRDKEKRPLMGAAVQKIADVAIVTSDNPRDEDPEEIIDQIISGMDSSKPIIRIADRKSAINHAISICKAGDVLLLAGKGHETYQILADGFTIPFDERKVCADMLLRYSAPLPREGGEGKMRLSELADVVNGSIRDVKELLREFSYTDIFTDTRTPKRHGLYVALKGENFDGYDFIPQATDAGALASVTERIYTGYPCFVVKSSKQALLDIAKTYRKKYKLPIIGITGSVGKTTTKEMTALALSASKSVFYTEGNQNNEIGVPKALLGINSSHTAAVIEMGMNHAGEISRLSNAVIPDICVITNIGYNHIEFFDSTEDILRAKLEILDGAVKNAPLLINGSDKLLATARKYVSRNHKIITFGISDDNEFNYNASDILPSPQCTKFRITKGNEIISEVELFIPGYHNILNALAAVAVADLLGADPAVAGQMLDCYQPLPMRSHIEKRGLNTIIVDCYNASPSSMEASLKMLASMPLKAGGRRVAVLGDMLETGEHARELHERVGEMVVENGIDLLVCYGNDSKYISQKADELGMHSGYSADKNVVKNFLKFKLKPDDIILFKASRGMHLETLIDEFFS